jgi:streptogramin lyase
MMKTLLVVACALLSACAPVGQRESSYVPALLGRTPATQPLRLRTITAGSDGLPATAVPWDIVGAPDGSMWFTDVSSASPAVGRVDPTGGAVREYRKGLRYGAVPFTIIAASDDNLWFADVGNGAVGKVTPRGTISEYSKGGMSGLSAVGIAESSNAIWVLESGTHSALLRADFSGALKLFRIPDGLALSQFTSLVSDSSGDLWFIAFDAKQQAVLVERAPNGGFTQVDTGLGGGHEPCCPNVAAKNMYVASGGTLWFTTLYYGSSTLKPNALGALKAGRLRYYRLRDSDVDFEPYPSGTTGDGNGVWVGGGSFGQAAGVIFHVDGRGKYSSFLVPLNPVGLAFSQGTHRRLWFTSFFSSTAGAITEVLRF